MRRWSCKSFFKDPDSIGGMGEILLDSRIGKDVGTASVAVKCVDISWNTEGEGRHLGFS